MQDRLNGLQCVFVGVSAYCGDQSHYRLNRKQDIQVIDRWRRAGGAWPGVQGHAGDTDTDTYRAWSAVQRLCSSSCFFCFSFFSPCFGGGRGYVHFLLRVGLVFFIDEETRPGSELLR